MVRITVDLLLKHASHTKRRSNESDQQYLKRLTHIYFQEKSIDEIDGLSQCKSLSVLYLYSNNISKIKNLEFAGCLTHLYLQQNQISQLNGLGHLISLQKLYLSHNQINVVEGLENCKSLNELHIDFQKLPPGEKLLFDPRTLEAIGGCLSVLNASGNRIDEVSDLKVLHKLNQLIIENNELNELSGLLDALLHWPSLFKLNLAGNPVCQVKKYKEDIIIISKSLVMIDNKEVNESLRLFLSKLRSTKEAKKHKLQYDTDATVNFFHQTDLYAKSLDSTPADHLLKQEHKYIMSAQ